MRAARRSAFVVAALTIVGCSSLRATTRDPEAVRESLPSALRSKKPGGVVPPLRVGPFVFYSDTPLPADDPVFRDLETLARPDSARTASPRGDDDGAGLFISGSGPL